MFFLNNYKWINENFVWTFKPKKVSPVTITVPHDRAFHPSDFFDLFKVRESGVKGADKHVWSIVKDVLLKVSVNAVRGLFPRHFIDYNRSPEGDNYKKFFKEEKQPAFNDNALKYCYDSYHKIIIDLLTEAINVYGKEKCLLLDLHGFAKQPIYGTYDLILGTGNRTTVKSDIDIDLYNFMSDLGYKVFLPKKSTVLHQTDDDYSAQFTAQHYSKKFNIDAIQIEVASKFRVLEGEEIGQKLAMDIASFINRL